MPPLPGSTTRRPPASSPGNGATASSPGKTMAAVTADGLFVPIGFEFMSRRPLDARFPTLEEWREEDFSLQSDIASANRLTDRPANELRDEMRCLTGPGSRVTALQMTRRR